MNRVRTAVVGVGSFGRNHARVLSTLAGVELTAVVDVDANRAEALAQEHNTAAWRDIDSVIGKIDAAVIATPTQSHEEISLRLLEADIDVLVEKPIAPTAIA